MKAHLGHLRVREILVHNDTVDKLSLLEASTGLALHLDEVKVHIMTLQIGHRQHSIDSDLADVISSFNKVCEEEDLSHLVAVDVDDLGGQRGRGGVEERGGVIVGELNGVGDGSKGLHGELARSVVAFSHTHRVQATVQKLLSLHPHIRDQKRRLWFAWAVY